MGGPMRGVGTWKNADRFQKLREEGSKWSRSDPLVLEELQWDNEWVDHNAHPVYEGADITCGQVDEAVGASERFIAQP
jgi:hypothetical protein